MCLHKKLTFSKINKTILNSDTNYTQFCTGKGPVT